jgi:hypothetical protein
LIFAKPRLPAPHPGQRPEANVREIESMEFQNGFNRKI